MLLTDCMACRYGMHDQHHSMIAPAPEGGFGGAECSCTGDCATRNAKRIEQERAAMAPLVAALNQEDSP